jgi:hypothetical protein
MEKEIQYGINTTKLEAIKKCRLYLQLISMVVITDIE